MKILFSLALFAVIASQAAAIKPQFEDYTSGVPRVAIGIYVQDEFNDVNGNMEFDWEDSQAVNLYLLYTWPGKWNLLTTKKMQKGHTIGELLDIVANEYPEYIGDMNKYSWSLEWIPPANPDQGYGGVAILEKSIFITEIDDKNRDGLMDDDILDRYSLADWSGKWIVLYKSANPIQEAYVIQPSPTLSGNSGIGQLVDTSSQAKVTTVSRQYKGYTIEVDGVKIGNEGTGSDIKDGIYEFYVEGDMTHQIRVNLPQMDFRRWSEFFTSDGSYTANIDSPGRIVSN